MADLSAYLTEVPQYRRVFNEFDRRRSVVIYCHSHEVTEAVRWFLEYVGKPPSFIATVKETPHVSDVPRLKTKHIRSRPELLCVVFGEGVRSKCVELARAGVSEVAFHTEPKFRNSKFHPEYYLDQKEKLAAVFSMLEDEDSRRTYASVLKHRISGDHGYLKIARYREYFHPLVSAEAGDWVVDGGASTGKTSFRFGARVGGQGKVFAVEPDPSNMKLIEDGIRLFPNRSNVVLVSAALSDQAGTLKFAATSDGSSHITEEGDIDVPAKLIDDLQLRRCDLVSLDVEGAEAAALRGAAKTIQRFRPKLQISIYHRREDIFDLPLLVRDLAPDYAFFVGHHDAYHSETDLYAIPRERLEMGRASFFRRTLSTLGSLRQKYRR